MPFVAPCAGVGICDYGDRIVVLDINRDRYLELKPELAGAARRCIEGFELNPTQTRALTSTGLFTVPMKAVDRDGNNRSLPQRAIVGFDQPLVFGIRFVAAYAVALVWLAFFHWSVKRRSLAHLLRIANARARNAPSEPNACLPGLTLCLSAFSRASLLFPRVSRCLPDALALQRLVTRHARCAKIVFGVQIEPFQAHCWVQLEETVLAQGLEVVAGFRPILALP